LVFWFVFFLWQVVPIMLASFQEQFDLGTLLRFPVSFSSYYFLYVVFGLSDVSTIIGGLCCLGIWVGVTIARPELMAWTAVGLLMFAVFNVLLVRAIFAWIDRWLSQRRTREILAALFMAFFLSFQLLNPAVWQHGHRGAARRGQEREEIRRLLDEPWVKTADAVQRMLPPGLAGLALRQAAEQKSVSGLESLAALGLFTFAAGGVLAFRLRAEYSGENLGAAPARSKAPAPIAKATEIREFEAGRESAAGNRTSGVIAAVLEKEMRSLLRTLPLLYAIAAPLLMVLIISGTFLRGGLHPHASSAFAFPLCVFFAQLGFHQMFSNSLGAEGPGIQLYFLSPTPLRTVLLAKNLFHSVLYCFTVVIAGFLATVRLGQPTGLMASVTASWILFLLPCNLAVGDLLSFVMPFRINPGRISRQRVSQGSAFLSLALQVAELAVGVAVYEACSLGGVPWLAIPVFLALAAIAVFVWLRILRNADDIAARRKDQLIATLMKAE
jgi:ABC-2 type transport system permease protein